MALNKQAQDYEDVLSVEESYNAADEVLYVEDDSADSVDNFFAEDGKEDDKDEIEGQGTVSVQVDDDEPAVQEFSFVLPTVPGGEVQDDIPEPELAVEEPEEEIEVEEANRWAWKLPGFMNWLSGMMGAVPRHSGTEVVGLDRAISYLSRLKKEVSRAAQMDIDEVLDIKILEKAMNEIEDGIDRLEDRKEKILKHKGGRKKKADDEPSLVKEAQKAAGVQGRIVITVPLLISRLARIIINGTVSAGHDTEDMFNKLTEEYDLTKREQAELLQLLEDMNYPIRKDRAIPPGESFDSTQYNNGDWAVNYYA